MHPIPRRLALLALFLAGTFLAGCETLQPEAVRAQTQGKTIGVVSMLGPKVKLQWIGTTVFNNEYGEITPADWGLDALAQTTAAEALRATGRHANVSVVAGATRAADGTLKLPEGGRPDFVVAIAEVGLGDPLFGTNQNIEGLGVVQRTFMGQSRTEVFSAIRVTLHDGTGKPLGGSAQLANAPASFKLISGSGTPERVPKVADTDMVAFREQLQARLKQAVETALTKMGLR